MTAQDGFYVGVITGTSMDAIDAVLVDIRNDALTFIGHLDTRIPAHLESPLKSLAEAQGDNIEMLAKAELNLASTIANLVNELLKEHNINARDVVAIGSHGQTIRHLPNLAYTLQIGDPSTIAEITQIPCIADFRRPDMAAGGEGAPLASRFHLDHFSADTKKRGILNLGGIANITFLQKTSTQGFDTGPANRLMDEWTSRCLGKPYDQDGQWARTGKVNTALLSRLLDEPYFSLPAPKSTGRELFNSEWLDAKLSGFDIAPEDVQRTLLELTAMTAGQSFSDHLVAGDEVVLCGGGAFNRFLRERLEALHPQLSFISSASLGVEPQHVEAAAFAWLAYLRVNERPGNVPAVTGAKREKILGAIYLP